MQAFHYRLYGLAVRSNQPLPCAAEGADGPVDLDIHISATPSRWLDWDGADPVYAGPESFWRLDAETWRFGYSDARTGARWDLTCWKGERIEVRWMEGISIPDIRTFLLNSALSIALTLRDTPCLHATAVLLNERAVLLLGPSGAGKSTTAAALVSAGGVLLNEDISAIELAPDHALVQRGHPRLRLLADSASAVNQAFDQLPAVWTDLSFSTKRYLDLAAASGETAHPARLGVIYVLGARDSGGDDPALTPLKPREALQWLLGHTYGRLWLDEGRRTLLFRSVARLTELVPVRRVHRSDRLADLPKLVDLLMQDAGLVASAPTR
jgi:hypothetical protein